MPIRWMPKLQLYHGELVGIKGLTEFGKGYSIVLPKQWVKARCKRDDKGIYLITVKFDGENITIGGTK